MASEARYYKTKSQEQVRLLERAAGVQQELRSLRLYVRIYVPYYLPPTFE